VSSIIVTIVTPLGNWAIASRNVVRSTVMECLVGAEPGDEPTDLAHRPKVLNVEVDDIDVDAEGVLESNQQFDEHQRVQETLLDQVHLVGVDLDVHYILE
jgi:hypothetical protein